MTLSPCMIIYRACWCCCCCCSHSGVPLLELPLVVVAAAGAPIGWDAFPSIDSFILPLPLPLLKPWKSCGAIIIMGAPSSCPCFALRGCRRSSSLANFSLHHHHHHHHRRHHGSFALQAVDVVVVAQRIFPLRHHHHHLLLPFALRAVDVVVVGLRIFPLRLHHLALAAAFEILLIGLLSARALGW